MDLGEAQALCLQWNIPFYSYRLPYGKDFFWGGQLTDEVKQFTGVAANQGKEGFVVVPFRETDKTPALFIRKDIAFINCTADQRMAEVLRRHRREGRASVLPMPGVSREEYNHQVTTMITALKEQMVSKMVLARGILISCEAYQSVPEWFGQLAEFYPDAFVFLVSVPGVMTWIGASPEVFLKQEKEGVETMALAGTRPAGTEGLWGEKEMEEQRIVSSYIAVALQLSGEWISKGPFSKRAGKVEHLCTSFFHSGSLSPQQIDQIRERLHPTPAVGGFPKKKAIALLEQIEGYERRYYAGYLGPVGPGNTFRWFVNLRCMEVFQQAVCLYVGGGITAGSDPDKEWEETELKSRTLLDIIDN